MALGHVHLADADASADGVNRADSAGERGREAIGAGRFAGGFFGVCGAAGGRVDTQTRICRSDDDDSRAEGASGRRCGSAICLRERFHRFRCWTFRRIVNGFDGSAVFLGVTALSAARDRLTNSYGDQRARSGGSCAGVRDDGGAGIFMIPAATMLRAGCCALAFDGGSGIDFCVSCRDGGLTRWICCCWVRRSGFRLNRFGMRLFFRFSRRSRWRGLRARARLRFSTFSCGGSCGLRNRRSRAISRRFIGWRMRCGRR